MVLRISAVAMKECSCVCACVYAPVCTPWPTELEGEEYEGEYEEGYEEDQAAEGGEQQYTKGALSCSYELLLECVPCMPARPLACSQETSSAGCTRAHRVRV